MFSNILKYIMNNKKAYHILRRKPLICASTYELTLAFEIPASIIRFEGNLVSWL